MHLLSSWPLKENIYGSVNLGCVSIMEITEAGPGPGDSDDLNSQTSRLIENNESTQMVEPTANFHTINMEAAQTEHSSHHPGKNTFNRRKCAMEAPSSSDGANNLESQMVN